MKSSWVLRDPKYLRQAGLALCALALSILAHDVWAHWKLHTAVFHADVPHYLPIGLRLILLGLICGGVAALLERALYSSARDRLSFRLRQLPLVSGLALTLLTPAMYALGIPFLGILILGSYLSDGIHSDLAELAVFAFALGVKMAVFYGISCCASAVFPQSHQRRFALCCVWVWSAVWVLCVQGSYGL